jgi:hypothetical protein
MSAALDFQGHPAMTKAQSKLFVLQPVRRSGRARPPLLLALKKSTTRLREPATRDKGSSRSMRQSGALGAVGGGPPVEEALPLFRFQSSLACMSGDPSSPSSQPNTLADSRGSGRSQSKHWNVRCPLPPGGSAKIRWAPHLGQVGRSACPIDLILPLDRRREILFRSMIVPRRKLDISAK